MYVYPRPLASLSLPPVDDDEEEDLGDGDDEDGDGGDRRPWTKEEDISVLDLVSRYGTKKWSLIGSHLDGRTGKQVGV